MQILCKFLAEAMQFDNQIAFQKYALERGIDADTAARVWQSAENEKARQSQENIAYAGLSLEEKALVQDASQFTDQMEWQRYALDRGIDADAAARAWQSSDKVRGAIRLSKTCLASSPLFVSM